MTEQPRIGVLINNLGSPDAPDTNSVRRYLAEFLSDRRVVETPRWIWWPMLHGFILRFRPRRSAAAYQKIWTADGSPLVHISRLQSEALQQKLSQQQGAHFDVRLAMRYGKPSITSVMQTFEESGITHLLVLPLYPQYSATTTASTFDAITACLRKWRSVPEFHFIGQYHDNPGYIDAVASRITSWQEAHGKPDRLMFSFHGLPKSMIDAGDPYAKQCQRTADRIAERLGLSSTQWELTFQSRVGPQEWLKPYTDKTLIGWAKSGIGNVQVVCPGFSADCLETLEEIAMENRETFLAAGGNSFDYIPALNDGREHIEALAALVLEHTKSWL